jgi:hypothetical protein
MYGTITVESTSQNMPLMAGNIVALCSPIFISVILSLIQPDNFTFDSTREIKQVDDSDQGAGANVVLTNTPEEEEEMRKASNFAKVSSLILSLCLYIIWPFSLFGSRYIFSKSFFTGWVVVSLIWTFMSVIAVGIYPVIEARHSLAIIAKEMWKDITGKRVANLPRTTSDDIISEKNADVFTEKKEISD